MIPTPPQAFQSATRRFHLYIADHYPTFEGMAEFAVRDLTPGASAQLVIYLDDVLSADYADDELRELWNSSEADIFVHKPQDLKTLLAAVRDAARAAQNGRT